MFPGIAFGAPVAAGGDLVVNTSQTGYQEIATDPSYAGQVVVMTYPLIGNYGRLQADDQSARPWLRGLVVAHATAAVLDDARQLATLLRANGIPAIAGVDTRALARHLRANGSLRGILTEPGLTDPDRAVDLARAVPRWEDQDFVAQVSPAEVREVGDDPAAPLVAIVDYGLKANIVRSLGRRGVRVRVLPAHGDARRTCSRPTSTGVVLLARSRRPGAARRTGGARPRGHRRRAAAARDLPRPPDRGPRGGCGDHAASASATTAPTTRSRTSTRATSRSPRRTTRSRSSATACLASSGFRVSQRNLNDRSVEGLRHAEKPIETVQYHPEGAPGPARRARGVRPVRGRHPGALVTLADLPATAVRAHRAKPESVLILGSGPVVIGQAAEFDYAGTQACRALRAEGVRTILVNSNPATIMTDPTVADAVYLEPLTVPAIEAVIAREKPEGLLAGLGGQTALNLAMALSEAGVLERHNVRLLGTPLEAIRMAEDREAFRDLLDRIEQPYAPSFIVEGADDDARHASAEEALDTIGLPAIIRPAFTLGGTGGGIVETEEAYWERVRAGLRASPIKQVMIERCLVGWQEIEYEVMRDAEDTCIAVCSMENVDPLGVHTGDSIVVAPVQTLTDAVHQRLRSAALAIIRALGVEGGCNVQFALSPGLAPSTR